MTVFLSVEVTVSMQVALMVVEMAERKVDTSAHTLAGVLVKNWV